MSFIKGWTFSVCATLLLASVLSLVSPRGGIGRFYRIIISVFVFFSFIFPFTEFDASDFKTNFNFENEYQNNILNSAQNQVETAVKAQLDSAGFGGCTVQCLASQIGNEIEIENVTVYAPSGSDGAKIKSEITDSLGIAANVEISDLEENK